MTYDEVIAILSVRQGLEDFRYFVGRELAVADLQGCVACRGSGWISGPRRIGKSSLAKHLAAKACDAGNAAVYVDASDLAGDDFDGLLKRITSKAQRTASGDTPKAKFESLAATTRDRGLLIVLDEFDHVAVNLSSDEQAFLRRLNGDNPRLQYLFVSRADPHRLIEEVPEVRSRLLGVCTTTRIKPLERRDLVALCRKIATDLNEPRIEQMAPEVWRRVGGHTAAVMSLLQRLVAALATDRLDSDAVEDLLEERWDEAEKLASGFWRDLRPSTRACLLRAADGALSKEEKDTLRFDGVATLREPATGMWLLERGRQLGIAPPQDSVDSGSTRPFALVEQLQALIVEVNATARRLGYAVAFQVTDEALKVTRLTRLRGDETVLIGAAEHLYKLLYEGGRETAGEKAWRMPPDLAATFKKGDGMKAVECIRHFHDHDPNARSSPRRAEERFQEIGELYEALCGTRNPQREDWMIARDALLARLVGDLVALRSGYAELPPARSAG